ncbi:DNA repair protein RadC [Chitinophaga dinghuensis]|uniref:DNA repair protein RadC n=1 Tax=Chitinophaga dinghuensis TaxID=1539050 RepID=A0A327VT82_9BACT|nr:JAB domain-containing protein [Chitinophaga dinghuensis]RAJ77240.1 DNA repair protein RadC [Chitinophaga dinghuensis]
MEQLIFSPEFSIDEVQLTYTRTFKINDRRIINSSKAVAKLFKEIWDDSRMDLVEQLKVLYLSNMNSVLALAEQSSGSCTQTVVDPRIIFATALKLNAKRIILVHNHPSGNTKPSNADIAITQQLIKAGKLLDIEVLDHIIITRESYFSMVDEGLV